MKHITFNIKWTKSVWITSVLVMVLLAGCLYGVLFESRTNLLFFKLPIALLIVASIAVCYYVSPLSICFSETHLKIRRGGRSLIIPYKEIVDTGRFTFRPTTVRVFGSGGFLGYTGTFSNNELGLFTACIGDTSRTFYIKTMKGKTFAFSCEQPDLLLSQLREKIHQHVFPT